MIINALFYWFHISELRLQVMIMWKEPLKIKNLKPHLVKLLFRHKLRITARNSLMVFDIELELSASVLNLLCLQYILIVLTPVTTWIFSFLIWLHYIFPTYQSTYHLQHLITILLKIVWQPCSAWRVRTPSCRVIQSRQLYNAANGAHSKSCISKTSRVNHVSSGPQWSSQQGNTRLVTPLSGKADVKRSCTTFIIVENNSTTKRDSYF